MNPTTEDYAWLAKDAYTNYHPADVGNALANLNGHQYKVVDYTANASGFHATAYQQVDQPHGIIIAYRGTDPGHPLTTVQDVAVDAIMVTSKVNPQIHDADRFTEQVMANAKLQGIASDQVTVAGHSLGGTLAEVEAWRHHLHGQTFNAYGSAELGQGIPTGGNQIINNVLAGDPVSAAGQHFGVMRTYATAADINQLRQAGYLDGRHGVGHALHGMPYPADAQRLESYTRAEQQLSQFQTPVFIHADDAHEQLYVACLDGTGNDEAQPQFGPETSVARIHDQINAAHNLTPSRTRIRYHHLLTPAQDAHACLVYTPPSIRSPSASR